ncbi:hypothetical protein ABZ778_33860 [Streptomyces bacillaris]|uniref:hypothetical protein n=1 Tax=Streptomyces bacillaris TaxID=68179 RepID=UPI0034601CFF
MDVRTAGAVLLLFGQHLARIAALPTDALSTLNGHAVLVLNRTPIHLPGPLAHLPVSAYKWGLSNERCNSGC